MTKRNHHLADERRTTKDEALMAVLRPSSFVLRLPSGVRRRPQQRVPGQQPQEGQQRVHARFLGVVDVQRRERGQQRRGQGGHPPAAAPAEQPQSDGPHQRHGQRAEEGRRKTQRPLAAAGQTQPPSRRVIVQRRLDVIGRPARQLADALRRHLGRHRLVVPQALAVQAVDAQSKGQQQDSQQRQVVPLCHLKNAHSPRPHLSLNLSLSLDLNPATRNSPSPSDTADRA